MIVMFRMTPEKKEKYIKKLEKMVETIEELKECIEEGGEYEDEEWDEEPQFRMGRRNGSMSSMKSRYSRRGGGY